MALALSCAAPAFASQAKETADFMDENFCVYLSSPAFKLSRVEFEKMISQNRVVFAGETHDQMEDHLAQLDALKIIHKKKGRKIVVGFEMLNVTLQDILDEYSSEKISERKFLEKANWKKEWGFDFNLYKPVFDYIREKKLKALALNVPKKIVSKIARKGIEGLTGEERKFLPEEINLPENEEYLAYLKSAFSGRGAPMANMFTWENYLASMTAWNEGMGASLAIFLKNHPGYSALVIAGNGHVIYNQGVPRSVKIRMPGAKTLSIYVEGAGQCPEKPDAEILKYADLIRFVKH